MSVRRLGWMALIVGCSGGALDSADSGAPLDGPLGLGPANPFPNHTLVGPNGTLSLPEDLLGEEVAIPDVQRLSWREGFSVGQTSVLQLPDVRPDGLPTWQEAEPGAGAVVMLDRDLGRFVPCMAELDAHPDAVEPALVVRPLSALTPGHRVAVAVLKTAVERPPSVQDLLDGAVGTLDEQAHFDALLEGLAAAGVAEETVAVAWEFPVADARRPLMTALDTAEWPNAWTVNLRRDADAGDVVVPGAWRVAEGTYTVTDFLVEDALLDLDGTGAARPTGQTEAELYVHIPESVADAPAGSVPVMLFGHGIFSSPSRYLDDASDPSGLLALADEGGFIVVATTWRGLTFSDSPDVLGAASDFTTFPVVPERLVQGQVNARTLAELVVNGDLLDDDLFLGRSGQSLPIRGELTYYGISLGGIQGAVLQATGAPLTASAFHVGGGFWSTMLERSSNWSLFETLMDDGVPEPADRQVLYAMSQLWWDPADPASHVDALADAPMLYQYALGDEQVPNLATEALARSLNLPVLQPETHVPAGLQSVAAPTGPGARALVQFDSQLPFPPETNRPAEETGAHTAPRLWAGTRAQVVHYLRPETRTAIAHFCGADPCAADNPGSVGD